jgi:hypothetical protein
MQAVVEVLHRQALLLVEMVVVVMAPVNSIQMVVMVQQTQAVVLAE